MRAQALRSQPSPKALPVQGGWRSVAYLLSPLLPSELLSNAAHTAMADAAALPRLCRCSCQTWSSGMGRRDAPRLLGSCTAPGPEVLELRPQSTPLSTLLRDLAKASAVPEKRRVMLPAGRACQKKKNLPFRTRPLDLAVQSLSHVPPSRARSACMASRVQCAGMQGTASV